MNEEITMKPVRFSVKTTLYGSVDVEISTENVIVCTLHLTPEDCMNLVDAILAEREAE